MKILVGVIGLLAVVGRAPGQASGCPVNASHISMSGSFSSQPGVTFGLKHFVATLLPMGKTAPDCYQKMTVVSRAEIFVSNDSLTQVFAAKLGESKIKDFAVQNGVEKVTLTGNLNKVIPIHFTIAGPVRTDGKVLLMDAQEIKADGIPIKALLGTVGEHLSNVLGLKGVKGVAVEGNTLSFAPEEIAHLKGYITGVQTTEQGLVLRYGARPSGHSGGARAVEGLSSTYAILDGWMRFRSLSDPSSRRSFKVCDWMILRQEAAVGPGIAHPERKD